MALADHIPGAPKAAERAARIAGIVEEIGELVEELDMLVGPEAGERVSTDMAIWEAQSTRHGNRPLEFAECHQAAQRQGGRL